jgi:hypothetical protein
MKNYRFKKWLYYSMWITGVLLVILHSTGLVSSLMFYIPLIIVGLWTATFGINKTSPLYKFSKFLEVDSE